MNAPATLSPDATAILHWCEADAHPCSFSPLLAVDWDWHAVSAALGLGDWHHNSHWPRIHAALDELHAAGRLAYHDHGPSTYGHTTTMLVPAPADAAAKLAKIAARLRGEWFDPTGDLESDIAAVLRGEATCQQEGCANG